MIQSSVFVGGGFTCLMSMGLDLLVC